MISASRSEYSCYETSAREESGVTIGTAVFNCDFNTTQNRTNFTMSILDEDYYNEHMTEVDAEFATFKTKCLAVIAKLR